MHFLGRTGEERVRKAAEHLRRKQLPTGGWAIYEGGPAEVSSSVKAYFVLKLVGDDPQAPHMVRARETILSLGGIEACNSFTRIYLAIFGQCSWDDTPAVPPEIVLLPDSFVFNIYKMSSWSRGIVVPLSIIWASKPFCPVPDYAAIPELHVPRTEAHVPRTRRERFWRAFFTRCDRWFKRARGGRDSRRCARRPWRPARRGSTSAWRFPTASARSSRRSSTRSSPSAASATPSTTRGCSPRSASSRSSSSRTTRPCTCSPASRRSGTRRSSSRRSRTRVCPPDDPVLLKAGRWLLDREVKEVGDWKKACPAAEPGGWYFEYANEWYPDTDDTAEVLTALSRVRFPGESEDLARQGAVARGQAWMLAMQNRDGGWGAFDKDCDNEVLTYIPFADHNAMIDPSCEDITGRALEAFHAIGVPGGPPGRAPRRGLPRRQAASRRHLVRALGLQLHLRVLPRAARSAPRRRGHAPAALPADGRLDPRAPERRRRLGRAAALLRRSDDQGQGPSTPSQTAWALVALFATGDRDSEAVRRGVDYLLAQPAVRRVLEGRPLDRHRIPEGLLPPLPPLRHGLPAARSRPLRARGAGGPDTSRISHGDGDRRGHAPSTE